MGIDSTRQNECGDALYWEIVKLGQQAIPSLIEMVEDDSKTRFSTSNLIYKTAEFGLGDTFTIRALTTGDVALLILDDIIPGLAMGQQCLIPPCGYAMLRLDWDRAFFKKRLISEYVKYQPYLKTISIDSVGRRASICLDFRRKQDALDYYVIDWQAMPEPEDDLTPPEELFEFYVPDSLAE